MVDRNYKCPRCSKVFKTESGRNWHLAHRHEVKDAMDSISQGYESKLTDMSKENVFFKQKAADFKSMLDKSMASLKIRQASEIEARLSEFKSFTENQQSREELRKISILTAVQGHLIEQRLGIPFKQTLEEFTKIMYPTTDALKNNTANDGN